MVEELSLYAPLVGVGSYLVVEAGLMPANRQWAGFGDGPLEAVEEFMQMQVYRSDFEHDRTAQVRACCMCLMLVQNVAVLRPQLCCYGAFVATALHMTA